MSDQPRLSFGLKTTPMNTTYDDILRVWREADSIPAIEHAWLWDHMLPLFGDPSGSILEGWTLLAALAAQTERLGLGLLVTSNQIRPPAMLAKMAATTDIVSDGRLVLGIGVGATDLPNRPYQEIAVREYDAYGLPMAPPEAGIQQLGEACTIIRRMWTEEVFDFDGQHYRLKGTRCEPKPVQRPRPPILIGGWGKQTLQVIAEHADIWNVPGPPHHSVEYIRERCRILEEACAAIGRDPRSIQRSTQLFVSYEEPAQTQAMIQELVEVGVTHLVLSLLPPYPQGVAHWVTEDIIRPVLAQPPGG